jgi:leucyl aminopeptidase (aminopeptidase T)
MNEEDAFLESELADLDRAILLGQAIAGDLGNRTSPLAYLVRRAREQALEAGVRLLMSNLNTPEGVEEARQLQREYQRFQAIMAWLAEAGGEADRAIQIRDGMGELDEEERLRKAANYERHEELPDV